MAEQLRGLAGAEGADVALAIESFKSVRPLTCNTIYAVSRMVLYILHRLRSAFVFASFLRLNAQLRSWKGAMVRI